MASVYRYDGVGSECSFIKIDGRIKECIEADWSQYILLKAGERVDPDFIPAPSDIIYMRRIPRGVTAAIVLGAVAVVAAVGVGIYSYEQQKKINAYQDKLEENQKKIASGSNVEKLPYVRGASNTAATGKSFPYILGETLFTPYKLCPDHIQISGTDGKDLYYYLVLECGFSNLCMRKIMLGTNTIVNFSENTPQNGRFQFEQGAYYDDGNFVEIRQTGDFFESEFNRKVIHTNYMEEIPHRHMPSDASQEEAQEIEDEWKHGLVKQLPDHVMSVEVIVLFDGLRKFDEEGGEWRTASATLQVQWTDVDNPDESDWRDFTLAFDQNGSRSNTFSRNTRQQLRYIATQDFLPAQSMGKNISVRIRRTTPKADGTAKDTVYLMAVQSVIYDAKKSSLSGFVPAMPIEPAQRDKCTRLGIRIKSTPSTDGYMESFSVVECGCARSWDGNSWSQTRGPERNLAAWVLELLTSSVHRPSQYSDSEIDMDSFGEWYEYCETNGIYADGAVTDATTKKALIETLCGNGNAVLLLNEGTGLLEVAIDSGRDYSVACFTPDNLLSMTAVKTVRRLTDGKRVTYVNRDAGYEADSVTFMRDGEDYDPTSDTLSSVALSYITDYTQAYRRAWRMMAEEIARPVSATVKVGQGGRFYRLFDCVNLQHDELSIGLGHATIKELSWNEGRLSYIGLAGYVDFPSSGSCGVIINCTSSLGIIPLRVSGEGRTSVLEVLDDLFDDAEKLPSPGDTLSFGLLDNGGGFSKVTTKMLITASEPSDDGYTLTLAEYNPDVYTYGTLPEYTSNVTPRPDSSQLKLSDVREYAEKSDIDAAVAEMDAGTSEGATAPDNITALSATAERDGVELIWTASGKGLKNAVRYYSIEVCYDTSAEEPEWVAAGTSKTNSFTFMFNRAVHGYPEYTDFATWSFRVKVVSVYNLESAWKMALVNTDRYGTWLFGQTTPEVKIQELRSTGRVLQASLFIPQRADGREIYGNIRYRVQIQRLLAPGETPVSTEDYDNENEWFAPATSVNPYQDVDGYKDTSSSAEYVTAAETYVQTVPLSGQDVQNGTRNTYYRIRVCADNGANVSDYTIAPFTATVAGIYDLVKANETSKQAFISELSALCANLGTISQGGFSSSGNNRWDLSTFLDDLGQQHIEGAFKVGGQEEYLEVIPILVPGSNPPVVEKYSIVFKVGKFEISSSYSKLNGEFIIQENEDSLDRTRLTPIGTFFEYRDTKESDEWKLIAKQDTGGILSEQVYSNGTLLLSNAGIEARRNQGLDIGNPYLSSASRVYHFDTDEVDATRQLTGDVLDQNGQTGLTVSVASGGHAKEVGSEQGDQYRPAIQVKAPYSEIGNSLAGQFSLVHSLGSGTKWTVDFWFQYTWAEGQEMFRVDTDRATVSVKTEVSEPNYNYLEEGVAPYNTESMDSGVGVLPYNVARPDGVNLIFEKNGKQIIHLDDIGIHITPDDWVHCAVTLDSGTLTVMLSNDSVVARYQADPEHEVPYVLKTFGGAGKGGTFTYNSTKGTALIDELLVDASITETAAAFGTSSVNKIPWGALAAGAKRYMLIKDEDAVFMSNINFADNLILTDADFEEIK